MLFEAFLWGIGFVGGGIIGVFLAIVLLGLTFFAMEAAEEGLRATQRWWRRDK